MIAQEIYSPRPMAASGQVFSGQGGLAGFFASTAGTVQVRDGNATGTIIVASFPVTAGIFYSMPFGISTGLYIELGGGATGTAAVI
jgi:hypothetical protein